MTLDGFPHSDIPGSKPACGSPGLIAACYVLRRLSAPRHPPSALCSLTIKSQHTCIRHQLSLCYPDSIVKERRPVRNCAGRGDATSRRQAIPACLRHAASSAFKERCTSRGPTARDMKSARRPSSCGRPRRVVEGGGEYRDRTGDLLVANQALSQLS